MTRLKVAPKFNTFWGYRILEIVNSALHLILWGIAPGRHEKSAKISEKTIVFHDRNRNKSSCVLGMSPSRTYVLDSEYSCCSLCANEFPRIIVRRKLTVTVLWRTGWITYGSFLPSSSHKRNYLVTGGSIVKFRHQRTLVGLLKRLSASWFVGKVGNY